MRHAHYAEGRRALQEICCSFFPKLVLRRKFASECPCLIKHTEITKSSFEALSNAFGFGKLASIRKQYAFIHIWFTVWVEDCPSLLFLHSSFPFESLAPEPPLTTNVHPPSFDSENRQALSLTSTEEEVQEIRGKAAASSLLGKAG